MKISEFKKLIREEVRKVVKEGSMSSAAIPTSEVVFVPYSDVDGLAEYVGDAGGLNNALYVFTGNTPGVIVLKSDIAELKSTIEDYENQ